MEFSTTAMMFLGFTVIILWLISSIASAFGGRYSCLRPAMSIGIIDYSPLLFDVNASPIPRYIKYHPKTGFHGQHTNGPQSKGTIKVVLMSGWFGWIRREVVWDEASLIIPFDKRRGWGSYMEHLRVDGLKANLDVLKHENDVLKIHNNELERQIVVLRQYEREQVNEQVDARMKDVQKTMPPLVAKKTGGR